MQYLSFAEKGICDGSDPGDDTYSDLFESDDISCTNLVIMNFVYFNTIRIESGGLVHLLRCERPIYCYEHQHLEYGLNLNLGGLDLNYGGGGYQRRGQTPDTPQSTEDEEEDEAKNVKEQ